MKDETMEEVLKRYAESEEFSSIDELLKTVHVFCGQSYLIEIYKSHKSYSREPLFFGKCYVERPANVEPREFPKSVWASEDYKIDEQDYPTPEGALGGALGYLSRRLSK